MIGSGHCAVARLEIGDAGREGCLSHVRPAQKSEDCPGEEPCGKAQPSTGVDLGKGLARTKRRCSGMVSEFEEHFEDREDGPMHGSSYGLDQPDQNSGHFGPRG